MKRMRSWLTMALVCAGLAADTGRAEEFAIQSFSGTGQLVFNTLNSATNYRIEWASSPAGPWTNFTFGAGVWLDNIPAVQANSVTCSVPMFYRVVATVTNGWLVLETAGALAFGTVHKGTTATRTLTLRNRGGGPLTVTGITYPDGFSGDWSGVIPAGFAQIVTVTFAPVAAEDYGGTLTVHSDAASGNATLALSGRGSSDYLVIDVAAGPSASSYPVSYLAAAPGSGWGDVYKTTKIVLHRISAGDFTIGSPAGELGHEPDETQHAATLTKDFYLGVFEVTQRQWELVMGNKPSWFNNATYYATRPVERVSYYDIRENPANSAISPNWPVSSQVHENSFMGRLRAKTGLTGFNLPTESQWEYACRAGTTTALNSGENLTSTTSDANMDEVGRYYYNGGSVSIPDCEPSGGTALVGSYPPNAWGLYDMHGNVFEWCLDWYGSYPGTVTDPRGATSGSRRVFRGGCFDNSAARCRSAFRYDDYFPDARFAYFGFRVCYMPPGQQ